MEKSEPSLVPEWLRGNGGGGLSHHFVSSQAGKSSVNSHRRSSCSNWSNNRHDKNTYSRSYSSSCRSHSCKIFEKSGITDSWDSDYSGSLTSLTGRRFENGTLERSNSMNSGRAVEFSQRRAFADVKNRSHDIKSNGNGAVDVDSDSKRVSFERDFPMLGYDGRPMSPDIARLPSLGLNKGVQGFSIGTSPLLGGEGWTSALAEVPVGARGNDIVGSSYRQQQPSDACDSPSLASAPISSTSNGRNMAEALVQAPVQSHSGPQQSVLMQRFEELAFTGTKKLVPMTPLITKTNVLNPSDMLKPKTVARPNDVAMPKNGLQQMPSSQLQGGSGPTDGSKSFSGMLLLKPVREKVEPAASKDSTVANGSSPGVHSLPSSPLKNSNSVKHPVTDRKTAAYKSNVVLAVDKRVSLAQLQSRNDFLNLIRKKSTVCTSSALTVAVVSGESEIEASGPECPTENGEANCSGDACKLAQNSSYEKENTGRLCEVIHPEEELELLKQMGWNDDAGDDEGLTEEEINAFVQKYITSKHVPKLLRGLQIQMPAGADSSGLSTSNT